MSDKYRAEPANGGERSVILAGWTVEAVFIGPKHAEMAQRVADFLNRDEAGLDKMVVGKIELALNGA